MNYQKMPFGKYKGTYLKDLPTTYKVYALLEFDLPEELNAVIFNSLMDDIGGWDFIAGEDVIDYQWQTKIKQAHRELSKKHHPDRGGSKEAMQAINEFKTSLL